MPKGQHLSNHQRGIVKRYYDNRDTIMANKLAELVSDLALCESEKKAASLWKRVEKALAGAKVEPKRIARIVEDRDVKELAKLAGELASG
ncbi:MAG: hypothetical protein EA376_08160 [Phycisphaeraceae bacterium]|nr:MAG: hypothetical protein EA376_08160 [Phycisphaeraceae bacterium]